MNGGSAGTRTRGLLREGRRSDQLNYAPHVGESSNSVGFPPTPSRSVLYRLAVTGQSSKPVL